MTVDEHFSRSHGLSFYLRPYEDGGIVCFFAGGCHPANSETVELWQCVYQFAARAESAETECDEWRRRAEGLDVAHSEVCAARDKLRAGIDEALNITSYDDADRIAQVQEAQRRRLKYLGQLQECEISRDQVTARVVELERALRLATRDSEWGGENDAAEVPS